MQVAPTIFTDVTASCGYAPRGTSTFALVFDFALWGQSFSTSTLVGMVFVVAPTAWLLISQGRMQVDDL